MKTIVNENVLRIALIAFNFLFSILSIALVALAVVYFKHLSNIESYIGCDFLQFPTILLIIGCLSFFMSAVGCYGAKSRNRNFFIVFILVLICLLVLELAVSIIAFVNIDSEMASKTKPIMIDQVTSNNTADKENFHKLEENINCCGIDGPHNYLDAEWMDKNHTSCCGYKNCMAELTDNYSHIWFEDGCANTVAYQTQRIAAEAAAIATIYSFLQGLEIGCVFLILNLT